MVSLPLLNDAYCGSRKVVSVLDQMSPDKNLGLWKKFDK